MNPTGFSFEQYKTMFALDDASLSQSMLDFMPGLSSFGCEGRLLGYDIVSFDPLLGKTDDEKRAVSNQYMDSLADWVSEDIARQRHRDGILEMTDYLLQASDHNRQVCSWNDLMAWEEKPLALALVPFCFFREVDVLEDMLASVAKLTRVAQELRIFPLLDGEGETPEALGPLMLTLQSMGYGIEIVAVEGDHPYGGRSMLRIVSQVCEVK
jgi:hypothetical protein